jgi:Tol biopolymer transport system component
LAALPGTLEWVSLAADGTPGNDSSEAPSLSANGRFVAFVSRASNLAPDDSSEDCIDTALDPSQFSCSDVFVRDRQSGMVERVSVASDGTPGNHESGIRYEQGSLSSISGDGRFVAFQSHASNLVPGCPGVYIHDRQTGEVMCPAIASDGTLGNGNSIWPVISTDGRFVAFISEANNLVPNDTNGVADVFVHDRQTGQTERVSIAGNGVEADNLSGDMGGFPSLSADGRFVAFASFAGNLVTDDTNGKADIFVHDRQTGMTVRVSVAGDGVQANGASSYPTLSADGRFVAFQSEASNLVPNDTNGVADVFVHDRQTGQTMQINVATDGTQARREDSGRATLSADGRWVAFTSEAANLVEGDTNGVADVFVHDRQTGQTVRVSVASDGREANGESNMPTLSADGRFIAFWSLANNLMPGDTNERGDIFIRDLQG